MVWPVTVTHSFAASIQTKNASSVVEEALWFESDLVW
jgi:hypothetical protein